MSGRFSVNNLFTRISEIVSNAVKSVVQGIFTTLKEHGLGIIKILALLKQLYDAFRQEIKWLASNIGKLPSTIGREIGKLTNGLGKQIQRLPDDFQKRLFRFGRDIDSGVRRIISPFQKEVTKGLNTASNNIVKFQRNIQDTGKAVNKVANDVKNIPQNAARNVVKSIGDEAPKILNKSSNAVIELTNKMVTRVPLLKQAQRSFTQLDEILKPVAKNATGIGRLLSKAPGLVDDAGKILKATAQGGKGVVRALPFLGGLIEALEWEFFKREFRQLFKRVEQVFPRIDELYQQNLKERGTQIRQQKQIDNIERMLSQMTGRTPAGSNNQISATLSSEQINTIANSVVRALQATGIPNSATIANTVTNALKPQLDRSVNIDYGRIENAINKGVATIKIPQQQQQNNAEVIKAVNDLKPLFPRMTDVISQVNNHTTRTVQGSQSNGFTSITNQIGDVKQLLQTVNQSVVNNTTTINNINRTTQATGVTIEQLNNAENRLTGEIRAVGRTAGNNPNNADKNDVQTLLREIQKIDITGKITVNPTPVTVNPTPVNITTQQVMPVDYTRINNHTTQEANRIISRIPSQQKDPDVTQALDFSRKTYNLLGGQALEDGLNWNFENSIKEQGVKQYQGMSNVVNNIPLLMTALAAPIFMRGGLHRFPSTLPSDVNNPNASPANITDSVGLQRHYHSLIDQRLGAPAAMKVTNPDGSITTSIARNVNEGLDTVTAQNVAMQEEIAILQQTCTKLAAETLKVANIVMTDHHILESIRDFCGFRYSESKYSTPSEISLGKDNLLDWMKQGSLHGIAQKFDGKMDLTEMLQKLYLEIGKVSASTFSRFDAANPNAKLPIEQTSPQSRNEDDDEWLRFVKLVNNTPSALRDDADIKAIIKRYTDNATTVINTDAVQLPKG